MPVPGASWVQALGSQAAFYTPPTPGGALCCAEGIIQRPGARVLAVGLAPRSALSPVLSHFVPPAR